MTRRQREDEATGEGGVASPCVQICMLHPQARLCTGCLRTLEEISAWPRMSEDEKRAVLEALPERRGQLARRRGGRRGRQARDED